MSDFVGLTATACADGCNAEGCVISGKPYCAHPRKGGLQRNELLDNSPAMKRVAAARRKLERDEADALEERRERQA